LRFNKFKKFIKIFIKKLAIIKKGCIFVSQLIYNTTKKLQIMTTSEIKREPEIVTIEKWFTDGGIYYWIIDSNGESVDGFSKKWQAIDAIERWGLIRKDKKVEIRK
jgi:hypothetical protein